MDLMNFSQSLGIDTRVFIETPDGNEQKGEIFMEGKKLKKNLEVFKEWQQLGGFVCCENGELYIGEEETVKEYIEDNGFLFSEENQKLYCLQCCRNAGIPEEIIGTVDWLVSEV